MRNKKTLTIDDRGNELKFVIQEMSAMKLESWLIRLGLVLAESGLVSGFLKEQIESNPIDAESAIQAVGNLMKMDAAQLLRHLGKVEYSKIAPLLNDLLECCSHVASGGVVLKLEEANVDSVISDVRTLFALQKEALKINLAFFGAAAKSGSEEAGNQDAPAMSRPRISVH